MKTAICFSGTCRSLEHTYQNLRENLINSVGDCDIFMFVPKNPDAYKALKFLNIPQLKKVLIEEEPNYDISNLKFIPDWPPPRSSPQIYYRMIKSRERCADMLREYEEQQKIQYERVIFSRLDVKYFKTVGEIINELALSNLYIPDFHNNYGGVMDGYNDRFAVSSRKNMDIYMRIPESLEDYQKAGNLVHGETILKWHLLKNDINVKKIPLRFSRTRSNGEEIDLRLKCSPLGERDS